MTNKAYKIRIALIGNFPFPTDYIDGGVQAVFAYLVDALQNFYELDLHIITFKSSQKEYRKLNCDGYQLYLLPEQSLGLLTYYHKDINIINKCLDLINPDIVHVQNAGYLGYAAIKSKYPALITFHGMLREDAKYISKLRKRIRYNVYSFIFENYCVRNVKNAIVISPYVEKYFGKRLNAKTYFIPNPVKEDFFHMQNCEQANRVLFAGRIIPRKGIEDLIKALVIIKDKVNIKVVLAGSADVDGIYLNKITKYIQDNKISDKIIFLGLLGTSSTN